MFLMWLGEQITERGVGNGISMLIFAGIVAGHAKCYGACRWSRHDRAISVSWRWCAAAAVAIAVVGAVVFMERGQRRITVNYAQRQQGRRCMPPSKVTCRSR
jgi:preprotein translocase subunit SecY